MVNSYGLLITLQLASGTSTGMVMATMAPALVALVDLRHSSSHYANAFALFEMGLSLSFLLGMTSWQVLSKNYFSRLSKTKPQYVRKRLIVFIMQENARLS